MNRQQQALLAILMVLFYASPAWGADSYVTSSADSGPGTFREAAAYSNTATGVQTIEIIVSDQINIINTINIQSPVIIQGNHNTVSSNGYTVLHLMAGSDGSIIRNMVITDASYYSAPAGIKIESDHNTVTGCVIGTNWLGQSGESNYHGIYFYYADDNYIGGTRAEGNVISGNSNYGVYLYYSHRNFIVGNTIGLVPAKDSARPNASGIGLVRSNYNQIGLPDINFYNIISGNRSSGIYFDNASNYNQVQSNLIGVNEASATFTGQDYGINIAGSNNLIGGELIELRNVISGNEGTDVYISGKHNMLTRNFIGSNVSGTQVIPGFAASRIYLTSSASGNIIGTKDKGFGNLIVGGYYGITLDYYNYYQQGCTNNGLFGNVIHGFQTEGIRINHYYYYNYTSHMPTITHAHSSRLWGISEPNDYIEVFQAPGSEGGSVSFLGATEC